MNIRDEAELDERWSLDDLQRAHEVLDAIEAAEAEAYERARKEQQ